jgi:hypothetical protein
MQYAAAIDSPAAATGVEVSIRHANPLLVPNGKETRAAAKAPSIQFSPDHERELKALVRTHSAPQKLTGRGRIILLVADGPGVSETTQPMGIWGAR